jgi:hypothetical protein
MSIIQKESLEKLSIRFLPLILLLGAFFLIPFKQLSGFNLMPGDIGDARLNNYFLENIYLFLIGKNDSLWQLGFFAPFPFVLGFSDNLFGSSPIYLIARILQFKTDTSFQIWFYFGYVANYFAAYYSLRKLQFSVMASIVGALIFTFALPTTAHAGHAQLHYRFGIPLTIVFFIKFLEMQDWKALCLSGIWLTWQFYAGIYMGFFTIMVLIGLMFSYLIYGLLSQKGKIYLVIRPFIQSVNLQNKKSVVLFGVTIFCLLSLLLILFYPYLQVSHLYGAKRNWDEISTMLPRPQSYFLSDASKLYSTREVFSGIPMRHEHQMFVGITPLLLLLFGLIIGFVSKRSLCFFLIVGSLFMMVLTTLFISNTSIWFYLYQFPLASAIRAITRIDQVLLFLAAYLSALSFDYFSSINRFFKRVTFIIFIPLLVFEFSNTEMLTSSKQVWRDRLSMVEKLLPIEIKKTDILFIAQKHGPFYADEIDAMWVSMNYGVKTLNGYSGNAPPGFNTKYLDNCEELPLRVNSYTKFINQENNLDAYKNIISKVIPIGFEGCQSNWLDTPPLSYGPLKSNSVADIQHLVYRFDRIDEIAGRRIVQLTILNNGSKTIYSRANQIRLSWRFLDENKKPLSGWNARYVITQNIPENGEIKIEIPFEKNINSQENVLQISLVKEMSFWAHDHGLKPLEVSWK